MESPFPGKPNIRRYSIIPARAMQDERLRAGHYKLLACLGMYANQHGVCWPSQVQICLHTGYVRTTISVLLRKLIACGYVRKLAWRPYKKGIRRRSKWKSNRYQILWETPNDPLPSLEQFWAPQPRFAKSGEDDDLEVTLEVNGKQEGGSGEKKGDYQLLANAFKVAVERASGVHRLVAPSLEAAEALYNQGVTVESVAKMTAKCCEDWMKRGKTPPVNLKQVADWGAMWK